MHRGLRFLFALWLAMTLVVAPLGMARAAPCTDPGQSSAMPEGHGHHGASVRSLTPAVHAEAMGVGGAGARTDHAGIDCAAGHLCCASTCLGTLMPAAVSVPAAVLAGRTVPHVAEALLPDGIASAPPLGPPRSTI